MSYAEHGADVNLANKTDFTPLHHAAEAGMAAAVKELIALGTDPGARNRFRHAPLDTATRLGRD